VFVLEPMALMPDTLRLRWLTDDEVVILTGMTERWRAQLELTDD